MCGYFPAMTIDPTGPTPVYRQIADQVAERIASGELAPHTRIPTEKDIVDLYGVARSTARHAVEELRERSLVYTVGGRGTYVSPSE